MDIEVIDHDIVSSESFRDPSEELLLVFSLY